MAIDAEEELDRLRRILVSDVEIWKTLQHQFMVLNQRTQSIFTLGGLTITVTGFSGHRIVLAGPWSAFSLVAGLCLVLFSLIMALYGISRINWISLFPGKNADESFLRIIMARNRKTRHFNLALAILLLGLALYVLGVSLFLLKSAGGSLPV